MPEVVAIDAHVHLYDPGAALETLRAGARRIAAAVPGAVPAVMLAERAGQHVFERLRPVLRATAEAESLWLEGDHPPLLVLAGRQVVTAERLEVLALATTAAPAEGRPAGAVLAELARAEALAVLPWGVGKWLGARGAVVDRLVAAAAPGALFLGDNGGRPGFWAEPRFARLPVLSGSDPLPIAGGAAAVGRCGSVLAAGLSADRPAADLRHALRAPGVSPRRFGTQAGPLRFLSEQIRLRLAAKVAA